MPYLTLGHDQGDSDQEDFSECFPKVFMPQQSWIRTCLYINVVVHCPGRFILTAVTVLDSNGLSGLHLWGGALCLFLTKLQIILEWLKSPHHKNSTTNTYMSHLWEGFLLCRRKKVVFFFFFWRGRNSDVTDSSDLTFMKLFKKHKVKIFLIRALLRCRDKKNNNNTCPFTL